MASDTAVGLYTGQTADQLAMGRYNQSFDTVSTSSPVTTTGTSTEGGTSNGTSNQYNSQLNTTPKILGNLESFIAQMTDRPAISQAELDKQAPLATMKFAPNMNGGSWVWVDPTNSRTFYTKEQADAFNSGQQIKRQKLIQEAGIVKGGTDEQRAISDKRLEEIERNRTTQAGYTKDAAFADAKALSAYFQRMLMETQLPGILRAAEGAGTSQGSMRALLQTRAAEVTAEQAAKLGIDAASSYGQINNQLAGVLEELTKQDPNSVSAQLLQALSIGKGIAGSGNQSGNQQQTSNKTGTQNQIQGPKTVTESKSYIPQSFATAPNLDLGAAAIRPITGSGYVIAHDPVQQAAANNEVYNTPNGGGTPISFDTDDDGNIIR